MDNAHIVAVVSTDGCGQCTGIDTLEVAAVGNPITLMPEVKDQLELNWIEPESVIRPKVMQGKGVAKLQFAINKHDINLTMGNNRAELERMVETIAPVLSDSLATLNSLTISGMASADGSLPFNTALAERRAQSARNWLVAQAKPPTAPGEQNHAHRFASRRMGSGASAIVANGNADSAAVKNILEKYAGSNDDVQERAYSPFAVLERYQKPLFAERPQGGIRLHLYTQEFYNR